ncbi:MAG: hypothetical protein R3F07_14640 [Opitutaceae bacterium]
MTVIPPFAGVSLVEYRDRIELTPYYWVREFVGLGRMKASEAAPAPDDKMRPLFDAAMGDGDIWVIGRWRRFEDGREEAINLNYLDSRLTEAEARKELDRMVDFAKHTKEELQALANCFKASDEDLAYIEERFPDIKSGPPDPKAREEFDVYQARLKVLAGMQPMTAELVYRADTAEKAEDRERFQKEAVQAFFAEMAHKWTEDLVLDWQRNNPVGSKWMVEFARVLQEPEKDIEPINYELAFNWLRMKYNLLTENELSDAILLRTGQRLMPGTLKKRRERLGLTTQRTPGPRPNSDQ